MLFNGPFAVPLSSPPKLWPATLTSLGPRHTSHSWQVAYAQHWVFLWSGGCLGFSPPCNTTHRVTQLASNIPTLLPTIDAMNSDEEAVDSGISDGSTTRPTPRIDQDIAALCISKPDLSPLSIAAASDEPARLDHKQQSLVTSRGPSRNIQQEFRWQPHGTDGARCSMQACPPRHRSRAPTRPSAAHQDHRPARGNPAPHVPRV